MKKNTGVLVVEDEGVIAADLSDQLKELGYDVVGDAATGERALEMIPALQPNVVLMDIMLAGEMDGISAANQIRESFDIPVLFLTSHADPVTIQRARGSAPYGYLVKPFEERELHAGIELALFRHQMERRTRQMERWLATTLQSIGDGVIATDRDGLITYMNPVAEGMTGWTRRDALGQPCEAVFRLSRAGIPLEEDYPVHAALEQGIIIHLDDQTMLHTRQGAELPIDDSIAPIRNEQEELTGVVVVFRDRSERMRDLAERRQIEEKMQEAQRLESLGVLAGGIAHDFNNILSSIVGNAALCDLELPNSSGLKPLIKEVLNSSQRATDLCRQMLDYAGCSLRTLGPVDLNALIGDIRSLLRLSLHRGAEFTLGLTPGLACIHGDRSQLQQVLMNLVMNASEALPAEGGTIRVSSGAAPLTGAALAECAIAPANPLAKANYVEVADTGAGIAPEVLKRIFDPFFTTKFTGRGLGLAAVLGIVRAHGGALKVQSQPGKGTTFRLYLPISEAAPSAATPPAQLTEWRGSGRALVIEPSPPIQEVAARFLARIGFEPAVFGDLDSALQRLRQDDQIVAAIIDVGLPGAKDTGMIEQMRRYYPQLPVILVSGFREADVFSKMRQLPAVRFLQKPFSLSQLQSCLQELLG